LLLSFSFTLICSRILLNQTPQNLQASLGEQAAITCGFKASSFGSVQWYRQLSNSRPEHIITCVSDGTEYKDNIIFSLSRSDQVSNLTILNSGIQHSALYFCAVQAHCAHHTVW
uniref:Ig-like domain-containing protein n=1 Tax=Erpetoichthys calabaricus TaxID=27687 RepID=A0A8C4SB86_ERPCA